MPGGSVSWQVLETDGVVVGTNVPAVGEDGPYWVEVGCAPGGAGAEFLLPGDSLPLDGPRGYERHDSFPAWEDYGLARAWGAQPPGTAGRRGAPIGGVRVTGTAVDFAGGRRTEDYDGNKYQLGGPRGYPLKRYSSRNADDPGYDDRDPILPAFERLLAVAGDTWVLLWTPYEQLVFDTTGPDGAFGPLVSFDAPYFGAYGHLPRLHLYLVRVFATPLPGGDPGWDFNHPYGTPIVDD